MMAVVVKACACRPQNGSLLDRLAARMSINHVYRVLVHCTYA